MHARIDRDAARDTGTDASGLEAVVALLEGFLDNGTHPGAQLTVRRDGRILLEAAGGTMRPGADGPPVTQRTLFLIFSATKPLTALAIHLLAERGRLELDAPVARYWPEFAGGGKEVATVAHVLSHQAGVPVGPRWLTWDRWQDLDAVARAMAERDARWVPGEDVGYHPLNFGWILGELIRRVDGRTLGRFVADEIAGPLRLRDTFIGLPAERDPEVAHLVDLSGESAFVLDFNRPEVHAVQCGAATGISTTDDLTRFYTMLLHGGELDGVRIVRPETIARATRLVVDGKMDRTLQVPARWALGFMIGGATSPFGRRSSPRTFGHSGHGCTTAWADPELGLTLAFFTSGVQSSLVNYMRMTRVSDAVLAACGRPAPERPVTPTAPRPPAPS
ncbi:beta-lactamase family protein [Candidatus Binatia bacterium]|nr:beta-lactamase family protein [Candidatus Binatia bacterium]